ncbi:MAG: hypothetical protein AB1632_05335 [Nitrospirota bacterium]
MKKRVLVALILFTFLSFVFYKDILAWDDGVTHKDLSEFAAEDSILSENKGNYLKNLGFDKGLMQELKWGEKKLFVKKWLAGGAKLEDASDPLFPAYGTTRSYNHFHNPLKPWEQAGLNDTWTGKSSLLWAQDGSYQQNFPEGDWSWQKTRLTYYYALTSQTEANRQAFFAETFQGLGHQMHLLQDTAVPDHVRNDAHPEDAIFGKLNINIYFESWAKSERQRIIDLASDPNLLLIPNVSFNISYNGLSPVSQLFDADQYNGANPSSSAGLGLSEYTNTNFFSNDTIFAAERYSSDYRHYFPFPRKTSTDVQDYISEIKPLLIQLAEDGIEDKGIWIKKDKDGENIDHFVRTSWWTGKIYKTSGESALFYSSFYRDEKCHEDYARKLIPRAVGYSAGLLDYFFRGNIEITLPGNGVYSLIDSSKTGFTDLKLLAKNTTSNGDEMTDGSIELVVRYKLAHEDPFQPYPVETDTEFTYVVIPETNNIRSIPKDNQVELTFDLSQNPISLWATDVYLQLVYRGRLGNEEGAVAAGYKDISEPTPIDIFNNMDKTCLKGTWYDAGSPGAITAVDTDSAIGNNNGIADEWDVYPHNMQNIYIKISSISNPQNASPTDFDHKVDALGTDSLKRSMYILSDYQDNPADYKFSYSFYSQWYGTDTRDQYTHLDILNTFGGNAIKNQTEHYVQDQQECDSIGAEAPCDIRYYPLLYPLRGITMWGPAAVIFDNPEYPADASCNWSDL